MRSVYITRLSKFLPNKPVPNDEMENVLGLVNDKPSKARAIVLRNNGIKHRYYAMIDGKPTHTAAQLNAEAINALFDEDNSINNLQLLAAGTTSPDQLLPSHAAMIHGALGCKKNIELISASGACVSSIQALKYAYMSVACGETDMAVSAGSERMSAWLHASRFVHEIENLKQLEENPYLAFEKDFLRWMLSDGAGAALLQPGPNKEGIALKIEWIEITSYAGELDTCMYAGAVKDEDGNMMGWNDVDAEKWHAESVLALKQDTRLLAENIVPLGGRYLKELIEKHKLTSDNVDYFLPHMSSEFFKKQVAEYVAKAGLDIPDAKWFYNLPYVGNVGSASPYLMLEELFYSGRLKAGEKILVMVPESARFTYAYLYFTVVG